MKNTTQTNGMTGCGLLRGGRKLLRNALTLGAAGALLFSAAGGMLSAQTIRVANRTRSVDELVRTLMDSEADRQAIFNAYDRDRGHGRADIEKLSSPTRETRQIRGMLRDFAEESSKLTSSLDDERDRLPSVRPYFSEVLKIRASSYVLAKRAESINDHRRLIGEYERIDQQFRLLSYNLRNVRGLSRTVARHVVRMEKLNQQISGQLKIAPQMNRDKLIRETAALGSSLQNLLDSIEVEFDQSSDKNNLLLEGRRLQQQVRYVSSTVSDRANHETIVAEYKQFQSLWEPYEAKLRGYQNRYVERSLRRIGTVNRDVHELLWLPQQVDKSELLHLTNTMKRDVDEFFERSPLKLLITLEETGNVLSISDEFYGVCQYFSDCVERDHNHDELIEAFQYVENSWKGFHKTFDPLRSQKAHQVLNDIEAGLRSLRGELRVNNTFDRKAAIELAAAIDNLARHLSQDIDRWIGNKNTAVARQARKDTKAFATSARRLHNNAVSGREVAELTRQCETVFDQWGRLHEYIPRAEEKDREHMQRVSARLTPYLVDLRTMLAAYQ